MNRSDVNNLLCEAGTFIRSSEIVEDATPYRLLVGDYQVVLDSRFTEAAS